MLSELKCGTQYRGLECLQLKTRRIVPSPIDMKFFYALLNMSYGASYAPWHVDQLLLGHPLIYGVWHPYKYSAEMTYKAFIPIAKFFEQGWDLKVLVVVPLKVKLRHTEKTIVGLLLAPAPGYSNENTIEQEMSHNIVHCKGPHTWDLNQTLDKGQCTNKCGDRATI